MLEELTHAVQCREIPGGRWQTIAAFTEYSIARHYTAECQLNNRGFGLEYRVMRVER